MKQLMISKALSVVVGIVLIPFALAALLLLMLMLSLAEYSTHANP